MRSERGEHRHRHVALVAAAPGAASVASTASHPGVADAGHPASGHPAGWSLLRMSVPARLVMVAAAALLLWTAVAWALS